MQKPTLGDFGLTKEDIAAYDSQMVDYQNEYNRRKSRHNAFYGKYLIASAIVTFASFVAAVATFAFREKGNIWGLVLTVLTVLGVIMCYVLSYCKDHPKFPEETDHFDMSLKAKVETFKDALSEYKTYSKLSKKDFWQRLGRDRFEEEICKLFNCLGYSIRKLEMGEPDYIMTKDDEKIYLKCQCNRRVENVEVEEYARSVKDKAVFVSLRGFKRETSDKVVLIDLNKILLIVEKIYSNESS